MAGMDGNDRQRKDRLIQTRVPQNLESTLKDEARRRRLSVSHLIRNVLEDTFNLVDNVVTEVDRVVTDSVEMAQTFKRDAARLAATARGETSHRNSTSSVPPAEVVETREVEEEPPAEPEEEEELSEESPLAHVYGFQELVLNRQAECAKCGCVIARGTRAYLGMNDRPDMPRVWVCPDCLETLSAAKEVR
ncbi:MAG: hypothetical protein QM778_37810 [Myxococcales bacterium]